MFLCLCVFGNAPLSEILNILIGVLNKTVFFQTDIEISGGSEKKTGQTVIRIAREREDYGKFSRD